MSRRGFFLLSLGLAASLHCTEVLGQDVSETLPEPGGPVEPGGEQPTPSDSVAAGCLDALTATGASFRALRSAEHETPALSGCGMTEPVVLSRGPTGISYQPPLRLSCAFALTLPAIERTIQTVADESLGEPVEVARIMGSYGCRVIQSARSPGRLSEHAFGNAIDLGELWTHSRRAVVVRDFRRDDPAGAFLRTLTARLRDSGTLERLLDPDTNAAHHNHFHLEGHPLR